jgi:hypothetical protein
VLHPGPVVGSPVADADRDLAGADSGIAEQRRHLVERARFHPAVGVSHADHDAGRVLAGQFAAHPAVAGVERRSLSLAGVGQFPAHHHEPGIADSQDLSRRVVGRGVVDHDDVPGGKLQEVQDGVGDDQRLVERRDQKDELRIPDGGGWRRPPA